MPTMINFIVEATYNDTRKYTITDKVCEGQIVFDGFLAEGETQEVSSCAKDNTSNSGRISIKRSDGPLTEKDVFSGETVDLG